MKNLFIIIGSMLLLSFFEISAQKKLTVIVDGFKEVKGKMILGIYNSDSTYMKKAYQGYAVDVTDTGLELTVELPEGEYAISLYHDVNENGKLDSGLYGIPVESYGFSNNAKGTRGAPGFEESKFSVTEDKIMRINLIITTH
jgi:uncharacterized protein (DUF2141 family)